MRKITGLLVLLAGICLIAAGCAKKKTDVVAPSGTAVDATTAAENAAETQVSVDDAVNGIAGIEGDSGVSSFAPAREGAPAYGPFGFVKGGSVGTTPDSDGFYTITGTDFAAKHPRWAWAANLSVKLKMEGTQTSGKIDVIGEWLKTPLATLFKLKTYAPIEAAIKVTAENNNRKVVHTRNHKNEWTGTAAAGTGNWITHAGGLQVTNAFTRKATGESTTVNGGNTDGFIPDGRGPHGITITWTSTFKGGRSAAFTLTRNNEVGSANFGNVEGAGSVNNSSGVEIAKVVFNIDGTGYYTLASENNATKHPFTQGNYRLKSNSLTKRLLVHRKEPFLFNTLLQKVAGVL